MPLPRWAKRPRRYLSLAHLHNLEERSHDNLDSLSWIEIVDEENEKLAEELYIELMIAQEEQTDGPTTTKNTR